QPVELGILNRLAANRAGPDRFQTAGKTIPFVSHSHGFVHGQAGAGHLRQGILFAPVDGHDVGIAVALIDKLDFHFLPNAIDVAIAPLFPRIGLSFASALFNRALIGAARGVGFDLVGRTVHDVNAAPVRLPSGDAGGKTLVGICDATVVLVLVLVFDGIGSGIATQPELLDELVALLVVGKLVKGGALLVRNDPADVLVQP